MKKETRNKVIKGSCIATGIAADFGIGSIVGVGVGLAMRVTKNPLAKGCIALGALTLSITTAAKVDALFNDALPNTIISTLDLIEALNKDFETNLKAEADRQAEALNTQEA